MCSETGKEGGKRGDTCKCDRDSPANQTWVHGSPGNAGGSPGNSASRNGFSVATGLCYSAVSPALILPTCLFSSLLLLTSSQYAHSDALVKANQ